MLISDETADNGANSYDRYILHYASHVRGFHFGCERGEWCELHQHISLLKVFDIDFDGCLFNVLERSKFFCIFFPSKLSNLFNLSVQ